MDKKTQQREEHVSTRSLPRHRVTSKRDMSSDEKQPLDQEKIEHFLQIIDLIKPHIIWMVLVATAIYDYIHTSNLLNFIILIGVAAKEISLPRAIDLLRTLTSRIFLSPKDGRTVDDQDKPT